MAREAEAQDGPSVSATHVNGMSRGATATRGRGRRRGRTTGKPSSSDRAGARQSSASAPGTKVRAQFGRKRTHNEEIIVAPCGVIIARATFYGAEAISSVAVSAYQVPVLPLLSYLARYNQEFIMRTYADTNLTPEHIFFDNNCQLRRHVDKRDSTKDFFRNITLSIDPFHFNSKHKDTDTFCQDHCNPAAFHELKTDDGRWYFNSSIAEQTNVWLANYNSMCREMRADRFNFFLDEMIMRHNKVTISRLEKKGDMPSTWSPDDL